MMTEMTGFHEKGHTVVRGVFTAAEMAIVKRVAEATQAMNDHAIRVNDGIGTWLDQGDAALAMTQQ